jgi:hypothetical protein
MPMVCFKRSAEGTEARQRPEKLAKSAECRGMCPLDRAKKVEASAGEETRGNPLLIPNIFPS